MRRSLKAAKRREILDWAQETYPLSARSTGSLFQWPQSSYDYRRRKNPRTALRMRLKELAASRPRFGYRRLHVLLLREGWAVNHKVAYRLCCEESLQMRTRRNRKIATQPRLKLDTATRTDERWSMEFVTDQLADGRFFRKIDLDFIRPGKPVENAYIESLNGRLREEYLSQNWIVDLDDVQAATAAWRQAYNVSRPHTSLGGLAPVGHVARLLAGAELEVAV